MRLWRILSARHAATAFSGQGARLYEGRWHSQGTPLVYTASSLALASVEVFVNLSEQVPLPNLVAIPAELPDVFLNDRILERDLPENWRDVPSLACRATGSEWFQSRRSVALQVPSAAVMQEWNILLNPEHPDFACVAVGEPQPFRFDRRMFRSA